MILYCWINKTLHSSLYFALSLNNICELHLWFILPDMQIELMQIKWTNASMEFINERPTIVLHEVFKESQKKNTPKESIFPVKTNSAWIPTMWLLQKECWWWNDRQRKYLTQKRNQQHNTFCPGSVDSLNILFWRKWKHSTFRTTEAALFCARWILCY